MRHQRFRLTEKWLVGGLALISLLLHLGIISHVDHFIFDEFYYGTEATRISVGGHALIGSHPSLGKLFIAAGIYLFGFGPWGWRIFSVIFGVASIVLFYLICRKLGGRRTALFASLLLMFENLTFVHSTLAMLDVFFVAFMMLSFLFYLQDRYALSGMALALSAVCKLPGLFGALVILAHWFLTKRKQEARGMAFFLLSTVAAFFLLMPLTDLIASGDWINPFQRVYYMFSGHMGMTMGQVIPSTATGTGLSYPWEWVLTPISVAYVSPHLHFVGIITPTIWTLVIPSVGYMLYEAVKNRRDIAIFSLLWFSGTYLIWIPIQLVTDRVTYLFYFLPTVGAICLAIGFAAQRVWEIASEAKDRRFRHLLRGVIVGYLLLHIVLFFIFSPLLAVLAPQLLPSPP